MLTAVYYLLGLIIIGGIIYGFFSFTLGRGQVELPLLESYSLANLPANGEISASDIDNLVFSMRFRGYSQSEVDWVLDQLACRITNLEKTIIELRTELESAGEQ